MNGVISIPVQFKSHEQLILLALTTGRLSLVQYLMLLNQLQGFLQVRSSPDRGTDSSCGPAEHPKAASKPVSSCPPTHFAVTLSMYTLIPTV